MIKWISLLAIAAVLTSTTALTQPEWLFPNPSNSGKQFPKVLSGQDGQLVLTYITSTGSNATIYVARSTNGGSMWVDAGSPGSVRYSTIGLQRQPTTSTDDAGNLHCVWEATRSDVARLGIFYSRSTDNGASWSHPALLYKDNFGRNQDFSSLAIDGTTLYVSYLSFDLDDDGYTHVFLVRSEDGGATWSLPIRVDQFEEGGACDCCIQNIAVGPDGTLAVAFRSNIKNRRDIWVTLSSDQGQTFGSPKLIQDAEWNINACPSTGPSLVFDSGGTIHFSWRDTRDVVDRDVVYYAKLPVGADEGTPNVDLSTSLASAAEYSSVSVDPSGMNIQVVMETGVGLALCRSSDGGLSFEKEIIDNGVVRSASPFSIWTGENGHLAVWQSVRGERYDIRKLVQLATSVNEEQQLRASVWTSPGLLHLQAEQGTYSIAIVNAVGQVVSRSILDSEASASGSIMHVGNISGPHVVVLQAASGAMMAFKVMF